MENSLPPIPAKRYFTIGEVGDLCGVKPHVLRYWEQEFTQLRPMKRRGNRRYYQHHEVLMIRRIRELLYDQGFTISGARNKLQELGHHDPDAGPLAGADSHGLNGSGTSEGNASSPASDIAFIAPEVLGPGLNQKDWQWVRQELSEIRDLLSRAP